MLRLQGVALIVLLVLECPPGRLELTIEAAPLFFVLSPQRLSRCPLLRSLCGPVPAVAVGVHALRERP